VGIRIPSRWLGRKLIFITAKLLKLIRITNADGRVSSAQLAQSRLLAAAGFVSEEYLL
jgi:hypothetical protein